MKIAVFGAGGVGGYFGGRLAQANEDVSFIARGEHLEAMREDGLRVESVEGDFSLEHPTVTDDPVEVGVVDFVLVATKAWQVPEAAETIRPMVGEETVVIGLQNGVEAADQLARALGRDHVAGGTCAIISFIEAPGHIRHAGAAPRVVFGDLDRKSNPRLERLKKAFDGAVGLTAELSSDIHRSIWKKFLFIAPVSGVGAVTRAPLGVCRSIPETRSLIREAMEEISRLAVAQEVLLSEDAVEASLGFLDSLPEDSTASMQRDILEGRPSELEAQNGAVVRLSAAAGLDAPVHSAIYAALLPQERRARGELSFSSSS